MNQFRKLKFALPALLLLAACREPEQQATYPEHDQLIRATIAPEADTSTPLDSSEVGELDKALVAEEAQEAARWVSLRPYLVLAETDPDQLSLLVSARLRQGYQLRGPMYTQRQTGPGQTQRQVLVYVQNLVLLDSLRFKIPNGYRTRIEE